MTPFQRQQRKNLNYNNLVDFFIESAKYSNYLGHYNNKNRSIMLYDVENNPRLFKALKAEINKITTKYKFIVLAPKEKYTNINILDIEL